MTSGDLHHGRSVRSASRLRSRPLRSQVYWSNPWKVDKHKIPSLPLEIKMCFGRFLTFAAAATVLGPTLLLNLKKMAETEAINGKLKQ